MPTNFFGVEGLDTCVGLVGPPPSGKRSLLFQHAVTCARNDLTTVFLSPQPLEKVPLLSKATQLPLPHGTLSRIQFKYPSKLSDLQELFDRAHLPGGLASNKVDCVIIDNFHEYFLHLKSGGHEITLVLIKTCAHIVDGLSFLSSSREGEASDSAPTTCFLSLTEQSHTHFDIIRRWFPSMLRIKENGPNQYRVERQGNLMFSYKIAESCFEVSSR